MSIKKLVKISFIAVVILIFFIFAIDQIVLYQFKDNSTTKENVTVLLSTQENMNLLVRTLDRANSAEELVEVKQSFSMYEKTFENTKNQLFSNDSSDIIDSFFTEITQNSLIKSNMLKLLKNEEQVEVYFNTYFDLQSRIIEYQTVFNKLYLKENNLRKIIEKDILAKNNFKLLKQLSDIQYYSKDYIFQYKNKKTFNKWINHINTLRKNYQLDELNQYLSVATKVGNVASMIETLQKDKDKFTKMITQTVQSSTMIHIDTKNEIERLTRKFQNIIYTVSASLFFILIFFIVILAYKVSKNISMSVDKIEQHVQDGLEEITNLNQEIVNTQKEVVFTMGAIGETRSKETGNHVKRVAEYSQLLALLYGLSSEESEILKQASPMHDIGKVAIPDMILNKPGPLNKEERVIMNTHTTLGYDMLKHSNRDLLKAAATVAHEHHEKWDGSGYPRGLAGKDIHIYGRITALADVFDALGSDRCYKKAWDDEKIFKLFKEEKGKHFDPTLITIFFDNVNEFLKIRDTFKDS